MVSATNIYIPTSNRQFMCFNRFYRFEIRQAYFCSNVSIIFYCSAQLSSRHVVHAMASIALCFNAQAPFARVVADLTWFCSPACTSVWAGKGLQRSKFYDKQLLNMSSANDACVHDLGRQYRCRQDVGVCWPCGRHETQ